MKSYPSISGKVEKGMSIYAFAKLDGSNIRAEWTKKKGFNKFGSRNRLLGSDQEFIDESVQLINDKYVDDLSKIFSKNNWDKVICFFEFLGENSFAGTHKDEKHDVVLFDINPFKKGILEPREYLKYFGELDIAKMLYHGPCNDEFVQSVITSSLEAMPFEGVVCKAKNSKKTPMPIMFKIKSEAWKSKLWNFCGEDKRKFDLLA